MGAGKFFRGKPCLDKNRNNPLVIVANVSYEPLILYVDENICELVRKDSLQAKRQADDSSTYNITLSGSATITRR